MRTPTRSLVVIAVALPAATLWAQPEAANQRDQAPSPQPRTSTQPAGPMGEMCTMHMQMMADLKGALREAKQAAEAGDSRKAAQKIGEAQELIEQQHARMHERMKGHLGRMMTEKGEAGRIRCPICGEMLGPQAAISNRTCPMDGAKIDSAKVTAGATREYDGRKVGFCCAGCAQIWDRLSADQKRTKMAAARPAEGGTTTVR